MFTRNDIDNADVSRVKLNGCHTLALNPAGPSIDFSIALYVLKSSPLVVSVQRQVLLVLISCPSGKSAFLFVWVAAAHGDALIT